MNRSRLLARAHSYQAQAQALWNKIDRLDPTDPESREAAQCWSEQAAHAASMAEECSRWAEDV
jgi:hypothetical protein